MRAVKSHKKEHLLQVLLFFRKNYMAYYRNKERILSVLDKGGDYYVEKVF